MTAPVAHLFLLSPDGSWMMMLYPGFAQQVEKEADEEEVVGEGLSVEG